MRKTRSKLADRVRSKSVDKGKLRPKLGHKTAVPARGGLAGLHGPEVHRGRGLEGDKGILEDQAEHVRAGAEDWRYKPNERDWRFFRCLIALSFLTGTTS